MHWHPPRGAEHAGSRAGDVNARCKADAPGSTAMRHRVALVFGGTGGLGSGCVRALARDWSKVAITYRQARSKAEELAAELPAGQGFALACDVSDATLILNRTRAGAPNLRPACVMKWTVVRNNLV